jgi:hypothetical protein
MLGGCVYGVIIAVTLLRRVEIERRAVHTQTAQAYAMLLAVLVLIAWFAARFGEFAHGWWLPLAVAAIGEPALTGSPRKAVARVAAGLFATLMLVVVFQSIDGLAVRVMILSLLLLLMLVAGPRTGTLQALLLTPVLLLIVQHRHLDDSALEYLSAAFMASVIVFIATLLGKWVLWTLRPDAGRATV